MNKQRAQKLVAVMGMLLATLPVEAAELAEASSLCPKMIRVLKSAKSKITQMDRSLILAVDQLVREAATTPAAQWQETGPGRKVTDALSLLRQTLFYSDIRTQAVVIRALSIGTEYGPQQGILPIVAMAELRMIKEEALYWATRPAAPVESPQPDDILIKKRSLTILKLLQPVFSSLKESIKQIERGETPPHSNMLRDTVYRP